MAVEVFDDDGRPLAAGSGERGELVCTAPFPAMPIGFWNDPDGGKYHAAYFDRFPSAACRDVVLAVERHRGSIAAPSRRHRFEFT